MESRNSFRMVDSEPCCWIARCPASRGIRPIPAQLQEPFSQHCKDRVIAIDDGSDRGYDGDPTLPDLRLTGSEASAEPS